MGKWFIILLTILAGCVPSKKSDYRYMRAWRVDSIAVYDAHTNALVQTLYEDNLTLSLIHESGVEIILSMDLDGHTVWRLEGRADDILFTNYADVDHSHYNLSKFEYITIETYPDGSEAIIIRGGALINGIEGLIDNNQPVIIHAYITAID
jgi:hypothetical protein